MSTIIIIPDLIVSDTSGATSFDLTVVDGSERKLVVAVDGAAAEDAVNAHRLVISPQT